MPAPNVRRTWTWPARFHRSQRTTRSRHTRPRLPRQSSERWRRVSRACRPSRGVQHVCPGRRRKDGRRRVSTPAGHPLAGHELVDRVVHGLVVVTPATGRRVSAPFPAPPPPPAGKPPLESLQTRNVKRTGFSARSCETTTTATGPRAARSTVRDFQVVPDVDDENDVRRTDPHEPRRQHFTSTLPSSDRRRRRKIP